VAPVATGVAYAEENGFVFRFSFIQGFLTPWIPVYWVVSVLEEIWAFFVNQPVWLIFLVWQQKLKTFLLQLLLCAFLLNCSSEKITRQINFYSDCFGFCGRA
jgi:hypothetical protein